MKLKNKLTGVQVSVPDALADELLEKGTYQTVGDYDAAQRAKLEVERERQLAILRGEDDPDGELDGKHVKETAAQKRKREAAEAAEREAAEKAAADKAAADKAAADAAAAGQ